MKFEKLLYSGCNCRAGNDIKSNKRLLDYNWNYYKDCSDAEISANGNSKNIDKSS